jgi:hypothetical protein
MQLASLSGWSRRLKTMPEIIEATEILTIELWSVTEAGEPQLVVRLRNTPQYEQRQLVLTIEEARDLVDILPDAIVRLNRLEAEET